MRFAVYYAPALQDPLHRAGAEWLGRDPETNATLAQPAAPGIAEATQEPRGYGFHCTLKPPFRLAPGREYAQLARAAEALAAQLAPFDLPPLKVADIGGFLALSETRPSPQLRFLADCCVEQLDAFRAPPSEAELARRRRAGLSGSQERMLARWGYPHVFDAWFFHMTLSRPPERCRAPPAAGRRRAPLRAGARLAAARRRRLPVHPGGPGRELRDRGAVRAEGGEPTPRIAPVALEQAVSLVESLVYGLLGHSRNGWLGHLGRSRTWRERRLVTGGTRASVARSAST